ncbi:MAG: DMT family transporter [Chthonomonadales bacterium]
MSLLELAALLAGSMLPVQAGINGRLGRDLANPVFATFVSFALGTMALLLYVAAARQKLPSGSTITNIPWWAWTGGILGAVYVTGVVWITPKIGVAAAMILVIVGQIVTSAALDHFGAFGLTAHPMNMGRMCGIALLIGGVLMVRKF